MNILFKKNIKFFLKNVDNYKTICYTSSSVEATLQKNKNARVAQRWSTSLPRRGSRVRSPSRALEKSSDIGWYRCFFSSPILDSKFDRLRCRSGRRKAKVPRTLCAVSRSQEKRNSIARYCFFFSSFTLFFCKKRLYLSYIFVKR